MPDKEFEIKEWYKDYKVKDSSTFAKDRAAELKSLTRVNVQLDGESNAKPRRVKVEKIISPFLTWDDDHNEWMFSCVIKAKVFK